MKNHPLNAILIILTISFTSISVNSFGQNFFNVSYATPSSAVVEVNGNDLLNKITAERDEFRKNVGKPESEINLPKAQYIFNRNNPTLITFDGLDFMVKDNQIAEIRGLNLSKEVLAQITDKLFFLDKVQFYYAEKSNLTYSNPTSIDPTVDLYDIKFLDKQSLLSLKALSTTIKDIVTLTKAENPTLSVELNVAKMREPNIDKSVTKQTPRSLAQLSR